MTEIITLHAECNGQPVETGCHIDGRWGQYGPDRLADIADTFGWSPDKPTDDPRITRVFAEQLDEAGYGPALQGTLWEWGIEASDAIEAWLNAHTAPLCSHCGHVVRPTSDGFYRHRDFANGRTPCGFDAIDTPVLLRWEWIDGEFYLTAHDDDDEVWG